VFAGTDYLFQAIRKWYDNKKSNVYKRRNLGPCHSSVSNPHATSPALTTARQRFIRVLGEFTPLQRWVDENLDAVIEEEKRLKATGLQTFGAALRSKAVSNLYTNEVRDEFAHRHEDTAAYIAEYVGLSTSPANGC
jgi:hypothetical protein